MAGTIQAWDCDQSDYIFRGEQKTSDAAACMPAMLARQGCFCFHRCFHSRQDTLQHTMSAWCLAGLGCHPVMKLLLCVDAAGLAGRIFSASGCMALQHASSLPLLTLAVPCK